MRLRLLVKMAAHRLSLSGRSSRNPALVLLRLGVGACIVCASLPFTTVVSLSLLRRIGADEYQNYYSNMRLLSYLIFQGQPTITEQNTVSTHLHAYEPSKYCKHCWFFSRSPPRGYRRSICTALTRLRPTPPIHSLLPQLYPPPPAPVDMPSVVTPVSCSAPRATPPWQAHRAP